MAKPDDIRVDVGFFRSVKTKSFIRKHGAGAVLALLRVWIWTAEQFPKGVWSADVSDEDLDAVAEWAGARALLIDGRWLEDDGVTLHDWSEHQQWVFHAPERSARGKAAAEKRWGGKRKPKKKNRVMPTAMQPALPDAVPPSYPHPNGRGESGPAVRAGPTGPAGGPEPEDTRPLHEQLAELFGRDVDQREARLRVRSAPRYPQKWNDPDWRGWDQ